MTLFKRRIRRREAEVDPEGLDGLPPLLRRVYAHRNVRSPDELEYRLERLASLQALTGVDRAAQLLERHMGGRILIVGDFDADGATSTAVAIRSLRAMGASDVRYLVPNRFEFGYGLTPEIVDLARRSEPDLIVTVDNGISSLDGVRRASEAGIEVLVTDHHLPGERLPEADAIVNPNLPGVDFPSKALAGVGVIFYVMLALRRHLREAGRFPAGREPNLAMVLDLVALGTVADVVPLDSNNRIMVSQGLRRIRAGQCAPGITALIEVAGRDRASVTAADLGFALGPRLNAAGRLTDMSLGIELLLCDDAVRARELAAELDNLNRQRREIEGRMRREAMDAVSRMHLEEERLPWGMALFDASWHEGVVGLVASRVKERVHRPVVAFARAGNGELKGSARSIKGLHIRDTLDAMATRHPGLLTKFGGHAMAAGMSLSRDKFDTFARAFDEEVRRRLDRDDLEGVILTDGDLSPDELTLECAQMLRDAGPWGQEFPEPLFDGVFRVIEQRIVGARHLKFRLAPLTDDRTIEGIAFNAPEEQLSTGFERIHAAFRLDVNEFRGRRRPQLLVEYFEPA